MHLSIFRPTTVCALALCAAACRPASLVDVQVPGTVVDPGVITAPTGATQLYNLAVGRFAGMLGSNGSASRGYVGAAGLFTDELMQGKTDLRNSFMDQKTSLNATAPDFYVSLHTTRVQQQQAREALRMYAPAAPRTWQGQMYAFEAYTVVWVAEMFCSGVPLTAVPLADVPRPTRGFTTQELHERAVALFDSAIEAGADSARVVNLARVGKGRALLALGRFAEAGAAVAEVPTDFVYVMTYGTVNAGANNFLGNDPRIVQVVDAEGTNGMVWPNDPRLALTTTPALSGAMRISAKYSRTAAGTLDAAVAAPSTPIRVADGLEARLIEAEAALAAGNASWLTTLNMLRGTCVGSHLCAPVPGLTAAQLPPLADPGAPGARLDLLMSERAFWLFLTGHRQGDLRRLVRLYQRDQAVLWPVGVYIAPGFPPLIQPGSGNGSSRYTADNVLQPPATERGNNSLYTGCEDLAP